MADTINFEALPPFKTRVFVPFKVKLPAEFAIVAFAKAGLFFEPSSK